MLARWGTTLYTYRKLVLALSALGLILSIVLMATVAPSLSSTGFVDDAAESSRVERQLTDEFGRGGESIIFLFDAGRPVADGAVRQAVEHTLAPLTGDPRVARVLTTWTTANPAFVSHDGQSTYAVVQLTVVEEDAPAALEDLRAIVEHGAEPAGLTLSVGGGSAIGEAISSEVEEGILRAETVAVPLTILIQLLIFGGLIAAGVPLLVGGLAIVGSIAAVLALSTESFQSIFAVNIIIMLGLGLGVDYSLFMVARFREEIRQRPVDEAISVSMATVGKAILFSGVTVIFGLAATQFFPLPAVRSMGQAGMIVVGLSLIYGLTFLPALLATLGPWINRISVRRRELAPIGERGGDAARRQEGEGRFWHAMARGVMRRPVAVLVPVLIVLILAGLPFLRLDITPGGPEVLPEESAPRIVNDRLRADFPAGEAEPIPLVVTTEEGEVLSPSGIQALQAFVEQASAVGHVTRVESVVSDPAARGVDWASFSGDPATLPPAVQQLVGERVRGDDSFVEIVTDVQGAELEQVVRDVRALNPAGLEVKVGGFPGAAVDTVDGISQGVVPALIFVMVGSYLILLLTFGSVFLPLKAIFMTLLSISASLGTLVLVFQDGRFENLLGFTASGEIISTTPILMFCILFGLSMDYEVLMLTRVQEEYARTGDNTAAVAFGLEKTAKVITGAAAIMIVVFGAFMLADIVIIKSMGFGLALAVLIDATIVRGLLVPATMRLMGRWNWWAPAPVRRVVGRLGLAHA